MIFIFDSVALLCAELTLPRRKELDPDQQLSDAHLQDTLPEDGAEDVEGGGGEATQPEDAPPPAATARTYTSATTWATPWPITLRASLSAWHSLACTELKRWVTSLAPLSPRYRAW